MPDDAAALLARFETFGAGLPHPPHARDVAAALGVSEGALTEARRLSGAAVPLRGDWRALLSALPGCGPLMALSRNAHCVSEIDGRYAMPCFEGDMARFDGQIALDCRLDRWHAAYALTEATRSGMLAAVQVFDAGGDAVHKVYQARETDAAAFAALIDRFAAPEAEPALFIAPPPASSPSTPGRPLAPTAVRWLLERAAAAALRLTITVGNAGATQHFHGKVAAIKVTGPWVNVLDPGFNLHLREDRIAHAAEVGTGIEVGDAAHAVFCRLDAGENWAALAHEAPTA